MNIYTVGFPRSGNTWLGRLLADILDASIHDTNGDVVQEGDSEWQVYKTHSFDPLPGPTIYIQRDPRDVCVSSMHYRCLESVEEVMDGKDAGEDYLGFDRYEEFVRGWMERGDGYSVFTRRYEDMHDTDFTTGSIWMLLFQITGKGYNIIESYHRQLFVPTLARYNDPHSMWRGKVGNWSNFFTKEIGELFDERLGQLMLELGYIKDRDWWQTLPKEL